MNDLETKALSVVDKANAVHVADQLSYDSAVEMLRGIKDLRTEAETHHRPVIDAAHKAHKAALEALKKIDAPLATAEGTLKGKLATWTTEQERLAAEERRRLEAEAQRRREEELEAELAAAEASGAKPEEVAAIIEQAEVAPVYVPKPTVVPGFRAAAGVSTRTQPKAVVSDMAALVRFVATNPSYLNLLSVNEPALHQLARAQGQHMRIPGVTVTMSATVAVRKGA